MFRRLLSKLNAGIGTESPIQFRMAEEIVSGEAWENGEVALSRTDRDGRSAVIRSKHDLQRLLLDLDFSPDAIALDLDEAWSVVAKALHRSKEM